MPKEITHWLIAEQVLETLEDALPLKNILSRCRDSFLLGAVLPDSPLYMKFGRGAKEMQHLAQALHDAPDSASFLKLYLKRRDGEIDDASLSLVLGMLTHLYSDSMFHPFVSYLAGPDSARHFFIETHIDLALLPLSIPLKNYLFNKIAARAGKESSDLVQKIAEIFSMIKPVTFNAAAKMLRHHAFIQARFENPYIRTVLNFLGLIPGMRADIYIALCYPRHRPDPSLLFHREYEVLHPVTGISSHISLSSLYRQTVQFIVASLKTLRSKDELTAALSGLPAVTANTGMPGVSSTAMHFFNSEKDLTKIIF